MVLKQIEPPVYDEEDEIDEVEIVDEAEREKDLGVVGDKVTADSAATAEKTAEEPTVEELETETETEPVGEEVEAPAEEAEIEPGQNKALLASMSEEEQLAAKRRAALRDEYTDEEV